MYIVYNVQVQCTLEHYIADIVICIYVTITQKNYSKDLLATYVCVVYV